MIHCGDHMREEPEGKKGKERRSNEELHEEELLVGSKLSEK